MRRPDSVQTISLLIDSDVATELSNWATGALKSGDFASILPDLNPEIHCLLIRDGGKRDAALLRLIANPANRPLVFHCSHGTHHTGISAVLLLSALGLQWETAREGYLLSNVYRRTEVEQRVGQLRQMTAKKQGMAADEVDMTNLNAFLTQDGAYLDAILGEMVTNYGSIEAYIECGLGRDAGFVA